MARFLVTGGCGFIGSTLVAALRQEDHAVRVLNHRSSERHPKLPDGVELISEGTENQDALEQAFQSVDACFHLAAPPRLSGDPRRFQECEDAEFLAHASTIFECAVRANPAAPIPVIYASSAAVYGVTPATVAAESSPTNPVNAHGAEKLAFERAARRFAHSHGVRSWGLRMFNVYGAHQSPSSPYCSSVRMFVERALMGEDLVIYGDGTQVRDFIHVDDVVACILLAVKSLPDGAEVLNVCTGIETTINKVTDLVLSHSESPGTLVYRPGQVADVPYSVGDPAWARRRLNFESKIDLKTGLAGMLSQRKGAALASISE